MQAYVVAFELLKQAHELVGCAAKPVETPDDQGVAAAQVGEGGGKARPVGTGAGGAVLKSAVAPRTGKGIKLEVEPLVLGGHPGIADQQRGAGVARRRCGGSGGGCSRRAPFRARSHT